MPLGFASEASLCPDMNDIVEWPVCLFVCWPELPALVDSPSPVGERGGRNRKTDL